MGRNRNSINKKPIWKVEAYNDEHSVIKTDEFPNYQTLLKSYPELGNRWSLYNFCNNKYKLTGKGLTPTRKYLYSHIKITKIGGKQSVRRDDK